MIPTRHDDVDPAVERLQRSFQTRAAVLVAALVIVVGYFVATTLIDDKHHETMERIRGIEQRLAALVDSAPHSD